MLLFVYLLFQKPITFRWLQLYKQDDWNSLTFFLTIDIRTTFLTLAVSGCTVEECPPFTYIALYSDNLCFFNSTIISTSVVVSRGYKLSAASPSVSLWHRGAPRVSRGGSSWSFTCANKNIIICFTTTPDGQDPNSSQQLLWL